MLAFVKTEAMVASRALPALLLHNGMHKTVGEAGGSASGTIVVALACLQKKDLRCCSASVPRQSHVRLGYVHHQSDTPDHGFPGYEWTVAAPAVEQYPIKDALQLLPAG
jgi:hypothetical protein